MERKKFCVCILPSQTLQCTEQRPSVAPLSSHLPPPLSALPLPPPSLLLLPPKNPSILFLRVLPPPSPSTYHSNSIITKSFTVLIVAGWIMVWNSPILLKIKLLKLVLLFPSKQETIQK